MGFKENTELDCGGKEFIRRVINARDKQHHGCLSEESSILQTESGSLLQLLKHGVSQPEAISREWGGDGMCDHSSHTTFPSEKSGHLEVC